MKPLRILPILAALVLLGGCPAMPPKVPVTPLEQIEAAEVTAQQLGTSITTLTCTKFVAGKCAEPGKALMPAAALKYHDQVQSARGALRVAAGIADGQVGLCMGQQRTQVACLAAARLILIELERIVLQQQGAKP